jgi:hypothetical protein
VAAGPGKRPFLTFHSHYMVNLKTQDALYRGQLTASSTHISCSHDMHIFLLGFSLNGLILHSPSVIAGYSGRTLNSSREDGSEGPKGIPNTQKGVTSDGLLYTAGVTYLLLYQPARLAITRIRPYNSI